MMVWKQAKKKLQDVLSESIFRLWIDPLEEQQKDDTSLTLACPDRYFGAYVKQNFLKLITDTVIEIDRSISRVMIHELSRTEIPSGEPSQLRLPTVPKNNSSIRALHPRFTFEDFEVGESNILAQSACRSISIMDDSLGPCLYINSSTGLGKTHLTHAIAHEIMGGRPMTRLHHLTAQQFAAEMVQKIRTNAMDVFKQKYHENCDILLVEDVQSLVGKKKTQLELNEVLDALITSGKRVVLTANKPPRELIGIDEEIRSRMSSGLVTTIQEPDMSTRTRIIRRKAEQQNIPLPEEFVDYLARHVKGDVRRIESAIIAISARAGLKDGRIDDKMIEEVVSCLVGSTPKLSAQSICELVSRQFNISLGDLRSKSRKKTVAFPRQVAMYLSRKHTEETLADIGSLFNRDHSTVMHSIKVVTGLSRRDNSVSAQLELLSHKVRQL